MKRPPTLPPRSAADLHELDRRVLWHPFTQMAEWEPLVIAAGEGNFLIDVEGRRYLDGVSSLWCNVHGHRHPRIDQAVREQLDRFIGSSSGSENTDSANDRELCCGAIARVNYARNGRVV